MSNRSIWPIDRTLSDATTPDQRGSERNGNEGVLCITQNSSITGASPSNCLVTYPGHSWVGVLPLSRDAVSVFYSRSQLGYSSSFDRYPSWLVHWHVTYCFTPCVIWKPLRWNCDIIKFENSCFTRSSNSIIMPWKQPKKICSTKGDGAVTRRFKKFYSGCKDLNDQTWSGRPKNMNAEAVLTAIEANLVSSTWRAG